MRAANGLACHTADEGQTFAGTENRESVGHHLFNNIIPDQKTGIGAYSLDEFRRRCMTACAKMVLIYIRRRTIAF